MITVSFYKSNAHIYLKQSLLRYRSVNRILFYLCVRQWVLRMLAFFPLNFHLEPQQVQFLQYWSLLIATAFHIKIPLRVLQFPKTSSALPGELNSIRKWFWDAQIECKNAIILNWIMKIFSKITITIICTFFTLIFMIIILKLIMIIVTKVEPEYALRNQLIGIRLNLENRGIEEKKSRNISVYFGKKSTCC